MARSARPETGLSPPVKTFYWLFQGGTYFVDHLYYFFLVFLLCFFAHLFIDALWSPAGKGLTSWPLSLSHWYPVGRRGA